MSKHFSPRSLFFLTYNSLFHIVTLSRSKLLSPTILITLHPALIESLGWSGFDFVFIDTEHTPADVETTLTGIRACEVTGMTPFVRVYENSPPLICKALDNGAQAVIIPHISTVGQAEAAVRSVKYPPIGEWEQFVTL